MKKTSLVTVQGKKMMSYAELIVLTDSQHKKLTLYAMGKRIAGLEELRKRIDNLAKDLQINWSIEDNGSTHIICIERTTADPIDDAKYHDLEIAATNFMSAIDKLELSKTEPECPSHDNADQVNAEKLAFVDSLIEDEESIRKNFCGIDVMAPYKGMPFAENICRMTLDTWFELLKTYSVFHHDNTK